MHPLRMLGPFDFRQHGINSRLVEKKVACNARVIQTDIPTSEWQKIDPSVAAQQILSGSPENTRRQARTAPQYGAPYCTNTTDVVVDGALSFPLAPPTPHFKALREPGTPLAKALSAFASAIQKNTKSTEIAQ
jgi:hypothetical protein